jgi:hypothetical protein
VLFTICAFHLGQTVITRVNKAHGGRTKQINIMLSAVGTKINARELGTPREHVCSWSRGTEMAVNMIDAPNGEKDGRRKQR